MDAKAAADATRASGRKVLAAMAELGYGIDAKVVFQFDPELRIMGYSRPPADGIQRRRRPGGAARKSPLDAARP